MKNLLSIRSFFLIVLVAIMACNSTGKKAENISDNGTLCRVEVSITGMTCSGCEQTIQNNVSKIDGITSVKAIAADGKAFIVFNSEKADTTKIRKAITESGYGVRGFLVANHTDSVK